MFYHFVRVVHILTSSWAVRAPQQKIHMWPMCCAWALFSKDEGWPGMIRDHVLFRVPKWVQSHSFENLKRNDCVRCNSDVWCALCIFLYNYLTAKYKNGVSVLAFRPWSHGTQVFTEYCLEGHRERRTIILLFYDTGIVSTFNPMSADTALMSTFLPFAFSLCGR